MKRKVIGLIVLVAAVTAAGAALLGKGSSNDFEQRVRVKNEIPASLIGDFKSFQKPEEVINRLNAEKLVWEVISNSKLAEKDPRPEFSEYSIRIPEFIDLGNKGVLELNFINRRLYKAVFYPADYPEYVSKLRGKYHADLVSGSSIKTSDTVAVEPGKNIKGQPYIQWKDLPLENEVVEWIKRFS